MKSENPYRYNQYSKHPLRLEVLEIEIGWYLTKAKKKMEWRQYKVLEQTDSSSKHADYNLMVEELNKLVESAVEKRINGFMQTYQYRLVRTISHSDIF
jgi:hypothetical protein